MLTGIPVIEATDWSRLFHAYGRATDTPGHLRALLTNDPEARAAAMDHLWSAIIHQGTPWTATGAAARVVAGIVLRSDLDPEGIEPIRGALFSFLNAVVEASGLRPWPLEELERIGSINIDAAIDSEDGSAVYEEPAGDTFYARSILQCIEVTPAVLTVMLDGMDDLNPRVRAISAMGAVSVFTSKEVICPTKVFSNGLTERARKAAQSDERSAYVMALGDLGEKPEEFLSDPSPAVRLCAALAPVLEKDERSIAELIQALEQARHIGGWFGVRPPQFGMHVYFYVVTRLVKERIDFDRLLKASLEVVEISSSYTVDRGWGPLLAAAFPDGKGVVTRESQRRYMQALASRDEIWAQKVGNANKWFRKAGIPFDREVCRKMGRK